MNIIRLTGSGRIYTSNAYLVMGDWKRIEDLNTLIDTGSDPAIIEQIMAINTGLGKKKIDQVILTHDHSDHTALLPEIKKRFQPLIMAASPFLNGVDRVLKHGDRVRVGDRICDIIQCPGHSEDSLCVYNAMDGDLFVGDAPVMLQSNGGTHDERFRNALTILSRKKVEAIYFGHGEPRLNGAKKMLLASLAVLEGSQRC